MLDSKKPESKELLNLSRALDNHGIEKKNLKRFGKSNRTVREIAGITTDDLNNQTFLSQVVEKLQSQSEAIGLQIVQQRMHHNAWKQRTDTLKECIKGIDLINSLRNSDLSLSSRKRCEEALLGSENKTLAQIFQETKQQSDQIKPLTMKYKEIGEFLYKIQMHCDYLKGIEKVSEQIYNSIHKEVTRKDRTIGQAELEAYQKQVSKFLEAYKISSGKIRKIVDKCKQTNNILRDFNIGYKDDTKLSIDSTSISIEKIEKSISLHQDKYSELAEKLRTYKPSQEIALESISDNKRAERIKTKLEEYYPEAARDMPEIVRDLAIAKDILMNQSYCDTIMVALQNEMKRQGVSLNEILQKSERARGYGDLEQPENERKTYVNAIHFLKPDEFSKLAKNGFLTFDAGVTLKHGPYSHRLQLNILHHAYEEGKIKTNPVELYKKMTDRRFINTEQSEYTVWIDIFDGFQLPRAFSVAGLPEDPSAWQQTHLQAYSNPFFVTEHPIETLPQGPLKKELALTRLRQLHFGLDSVVDEDTLSKSIQSKIIKIEQDKISKINTLTGEYSDSELQAKKAQLKEELKGMDLEQLEQRYIALGRKVPADFDLEGDYGKSKDKIIRDSSNKKSALDKEK